MRVDLVFVNENTPEGKASVLTCQSQTVARLKFDELSKSTKIEYAYIRHFEMYRYHIVKWYKKKEQPKECVCGMEMSAGSCPVGH